MCSLGIEPTTFRSADAMFYHWATQEHRSNDAENKLCLFALFTLTSTLYIYIYIYIYTKKNKFYTANTVSVAKPWLICGYHVVTMLLHLKKTHDYRDAVFTALGLTEL